MGKFSFILLKNKLANQVYVKNVSCFGKEFFPYSLFSLKVMGYLFCPLESLTTKVLEDTFSTGLLQLRRAKESLPGGPSTSDREG